MNIADRLRLRQDQKIVVTPDVLLPIGKTAATELRLIVAQVLDHRAHGAVEDENTFARCGL